MATSYIRGLDCVIIRVKRGGHPDKRYEFYYLDIDLYLHVFLDLHQGLHQGLHIGSDLSIGLYLGLDAILLYENDYSIK